jgi:hypothetical protein
MLFGEAEGATVADNILHILHIQLSKGVLPIFEYFKLVPES